MAIKQYEIADAYNTVRCGTLDEVERIVASWMPENWSPPARDGQSVDEWSDALAEYSEEAPSVSEID